MKKTPRASPVNAAAAAPSGFQFLGPVVKSRVLQNRVELDLANAKGAVYIYEDGIVRFRFTQATGFSLAPSYAVVYALPEKTTFSTKEDKNKIRITTKALVIDIVKSPCRVSIYDSKMNLLNADEAAFGVAFDQGDVRCFKKLMKDELFYGLGEKTGPLKKNGNEYTLWNTDAFAYTGRTDELYESIPFFYGIKDQKAWGIFFDNSCRSRFNFGASNNRFFWFGAEQGEMDYYFLHGPEIKTVLSSYTRLTGRMEMPPMWALGYQQCRYSYFPESNVRSIARSFRDRQIPCDVLYLDIHYMDGYRVWTWDKKRFPDPEKMIADLKNDGFKLITIIDPGVKADPDYFAAQEGLKEGLFAKYPDGENFQGEVWPSWAYFPDFTKPATREWWGDKLAAFLKMGVEGLWNDMNEPAVWGNHFPDIVQFDDNGHGASHKKIHNVYGHAMAQATREGMRRHSNKRHFILTRAGYAGIQRYSAVWTGDNVASEEHLGLACTLPQNMGLSGVPFVGTDVGGFVDVSTRELYIRWMQLGAFTPFFRQHAEYDTTYKEPWMYGEAAESMVRDAINLRYRLLPFLYHEFHVAARTGLPVMRPMILNFQDDPECYDPNADLQFMVGDNVLVAPVLKVKDEVKRVYLPKGDWIEMNTLTRYDGGKWTLVEAPLHRIPWFLKEGGMVPMQEVQQYVGEKKIEQTEVWVFPAKKSVSSLYEDDGVSYGYEKGESTLTDLVCETKAGVIELSVSRSKEGFSPARKHWLFKIFCNSKSGSVMLDRKKLEAAPSAEALTNKPSGFHFAKAEQVLYIKVADTGAFQVRIA
ncbi:MAG: TIM-barrel domain-containing protein [Fibrobacterota bacterium]